ncbi:MAG: hypothetical protein U0183_26670 [Polyangiaceae bacterium]
MDAPILRTLLLAVPLVLAAGALRPRPEAETVHAGVHPKRFWAEKARIRGSVHVALVGDSRVYHGLAPSEMGAVLREAGWGDPNVVNLGFSGVCLCGPYLPYVDRALDPRAERRVVVLGVTPHALTPHAQHDNGYLAESRRTRSEVLERIVLAPALDYLEPIPIDPFLGGARRARPADSHYRETFFSDGWVGATLSPAQPDFALTEYRTVFASTKVDPSLVNELVERVTQWTRSGVRVVAFRPPVAAQLLELEDRISGFDEAALRARLTGAGAQVLALEGAYVTYDGSHLEEASARALSRHIATRLTR